MTDSRSVLISGCSSGIGLCVAQGLQARGYRVLAGVRRDEDLVRLTGLGLEALHLDLDDPVAIAATVHDVLNRTGGRLYGLFNNGAYGQPGAVEDLTWAALEAQLRTNLLGWHELTRLLIPTMRAQGEGRIIQNSSVLGFAAMPYRGAYVCSKFALEGLSDTLRVELYGSGIHVSLIEPGPIRSRFRANAMRKFHEFIDPSTSVHRTRYARMQARLEHEGDTAPFTLPPEAVLKRVIHALESRRPKPRYYVTFPTYLFGYLKRVLSTRAMDYVMRVASRGGAR